MDCLKIGVWDEGDIQRVQLSGELDMDTQKYLKHRIQPGRLTIVDISKLDFIDTKAAHVLYRAQQDAGKKLVIVQDGTSSRALRILETYGLGELFFTLSSIEEARDYLVNLSPEEQALAS